MTMREGSSVQRPISRFRLTFGVLLAFGASLIPAAQATAAPAWQMTMNSFPTNLEPGGAIKNGGTGGFARSPQYNIVAINVGSSPTSGDITITDTLPAGITPVDPEWSGVEGSTTSKGGPCTVVAQTVTCTIADSVNVEKFIQVVIPVEVPVGAPPSVTHQATIEGGGAPPSAATTTTTIDPVPAIWDFLPGLGGFTNYLTESDGGPTTQAGSHPYRFSTEFGFPTQRTAAVGTILHVARPQDVVLDFPPGVVINPAATPVQCTEAQLQNDDCPDGSQIGLIIPTVAFAGPTLFIAPIYNMVPPPGVTAELGFEAGGSGVFIHAEGVVRTDDDYGISGVSDNTYPGRFIFRAQTAFWGDPSDPSHDSRRGRCGFQLDVCTRSVPPQDIAALAMPTPCSGALDFEATATAWELPGAFRHASAQSTDLEGNPVGVSGCNQISYEPTIEAKPTTNLAESPTGLDFRLHQPQDFSVGGLATGSLKDATLTLPEGMTLNPAAADGIKGCTSEQIGMTTAVDEVPIHFDKELPKCPDASKLGRLEVSSPALAQYDEDHEIVIDPDTGKAVPDPVQGTVYLAEPFDNPFDSLLAIYLTVEDKKTGIVAKVPAEITADPNTGQLVTKIVENPQLPMEDVEIHLFGGARAPLISPPVCGAHTSKATLVPWSSPETPTASPSDSFATTANPGGGSCPTSLGAAPNNPSFSAGTIDPVAGAFSPFVMKLSRNDATQRITGLQTTLPPGLIGKLAGVARCSEAQIAQAKAREVLNQGRTELASPSCPASSEVGFVDVGAGAGPTPFHTRGRAYLAGPYKGAPLSLVVTTPAVAGPYDLGAVVIRVALNLDPRSAQIHAVSDPIPTILQGIPLDVRSASLRLGRPDFTLNPTSCEPMAITGAATTITGQLASLRSAFQVGGCQGLGFKPRLRLGLKGATKRGGNPAFQAIYQPKPGDANLKAMVVRLPRSAFLDQAHIRTICTRVQFAADACPAGAQYGYIKAWTPLLEEPLEGPVWLRSSDNDLPDMVFDLRGVVDVEVVTRIDAVKGGIRASIESAPDAPITKVLLRMQGAKKGLIVNSRDICKGSNRADVKMDGQNGKVNDIKPKLRARCGKRRR